jgi:hypothetical protein
MRHTDLKFLMWCTSSTCTINPQQNKKNTRVLGTYNPRSCLQPAPLQPRVSGRKNQLTQPTDRRKTKKEYGLNLQLPSKFVPRNALKTIRFN